MANVGEPVIVGVPWVDPFPGSYHTSSTAWHFGKPQTDVVVTCVATFASLGKTVTIKGKITSHAPIHYWNCAIGEPTVGVDAPTGSASVYLWNAQVQYYDGHLSPVWGIWFGGAVTTPIQLQANGPGVWHHDQLVKLGRWKDGVNGLWQLYEYQGQNLVPINGLWCLDTSHPYNDVIEYLADGSEAYDSDIPAQSLGLAPSITTDVVADTFMSYMMYRSGAPGSVEVPIRQQKWIWQANVVWTGSIHSLAASQSSLIQPSILYPFTQPSWVRRHDSIDTLFAP